MDDYNPVTADEYNWLMNVLNANKNKGFVQRILNPSAYPVLPTPDGGIATHRMAWGQLGDKYVVFPTVLRNESGGLKDYGDSAFDHVLKTKNYIEFDNQQDADWFSKNYKGAWGGQMNKPPK